MYDLIFPQQTLANRESLKAATDDDSESSVAPSLSSFGLGTLDRDNEMINFKCQTEINEFLDNNPGTKITKKGMEGNRFERRLDGRYHSTVRAKANARCQYCYYIWKHTYTAKEQDTYGYREQNRAHTVRCLVCNVNLCPICMNEWHGVEMSDTNKLLGL